MILIARYVTTYDCVLHEDSYNLCFIVSSDILQTCFIMTISFELS